MVRSRALSCNVYAWGLASESEIPQLQFRRVSPLPAQILQAGWMGLDVLDAVLFNVLSKCVRPHAPTAVTPRCKIVCTNSYSSNLLTVSSISQLWAQLAALCSLEGQNWWLPLQLASCGQLICSCNCAPQTLECAKVVHALWAPSIQPDVHSLVSVLIHDGLPPEAVWKLQPQGKIRYHDWDQVSRNVPSQKTQNLLFGPGQGTEMRH